MISLGLWILTALIVLVVVMFHAGALLDFIRPNVLQTQIFGLHITLFGVVVILAYEGGRGIGVFIGLIGLFTGILGSFRDSSKPEDKKNI
ncbi:hypothetical protein BSK48_19125 [Paenibacillus odorifer]|uniref:hypothetical protein n=1 Tax=Paenibacillus odorifer TaxID=189426 RepID=UPI00096EE4C7|nr:hypothetical protein [Paenibacillus odorifer]OMD68212.1 hypothetical protein BSK48_19125 [Paenibacillus odorifer]